MPGLDCVNNNTFSTSTAKKKEKEKERNTLHRPNARVLKIQPIPHLIILARSARVRKLVLGVIVVHQILQDTAGLEQADFLAVAECVGDGGDATVGVDFEEPGFLLHVFADFDFFEFVGEAIILSVSFVASKERERGSEPEFFQRNGDLDSIWCLRGVQGNVWGSGGGHLGGSGSGKGMSWLSDESV